MQTGANFFRDPLSGLGRDRFTDARRLWKNSMNIGGRKFPSLLKNPLLGIEEFAARSQFRHPCRRSLHGSPERYCAGYATRAALLAQDLSLGMDSPQFYIELYSTVVVWFTCPRECSCDRSGQMGCQR